TCRICSAPAEPDQPLFHPCKCSGTIRYIHQDCLTTWLAHSKKKTCDICKHPYSFTKVYASHMPTRLPTVLVLRQLSKQAIVGVLFCARAVLVAIIWLAFLPWVTIWTWRMYFTMGDTAAWWVSNRPRPVSAVDALLTRSPNISSSNDTTAASADNGTVSIFSHPVVRTVSSDIVSGQIIASLIVLAFVAIFLLREWISQNARPGIFEEPDAPPLPDDVGPLPQVVQVQPVQVARPGDRMIARRRPMPLNAQMHNVPPAEPLRHHWRRANELERPDVEREERAKHLRPDGEEAGDAPPEQANARKGKRRHGPYGDELDVIRRSTSVGRTTASQFGGSDTDDEQINDRRRERARLASHAVPTLPSAAESSQPTTEAFGSLRRPALPSVTLPPSSSTSPVAGGSRSRGPTPLASPNLATYRPPEEFEAGPSRLASYFDSEAIEEDEDEGGKVAEIRRYFRTHPDDPVAPWDKHDDLVDWTEHVQDAEDEERDGMAPPEPEAPVEFPDNPPIQIVNAALPVGDAPMDDIPPEANEDMDVNLDDDMDGALEAIGLRGPVHGVFQNAALMIFILNTTIGLGIWLPFTIGKCTALLSLDPRQFLYILHLPLRLIRLVTDPIVDTALLLMSRLLLPSLLSVTNIALNISFRATSFVIGQKLTSRLASLIANIVSIFEASNVEPRFMAVCNGLLSQVALSSTSKPEAAGSSTSIPFFSQFLQQDSAIMRFIEPHFAPLGEKTRLTVAEAKSEWVRLSLGDGPNERIFAVGLGYAATAVLLAIYLNILTIGNVKNAGRAVRSAVRQQLLVVKVAAFIVIELVIFPLGCGLMLDACTVWLLPQGNITSRKAYLFYAPVTSIFYHWVIGTMFMYQFAILLAGCRSIMRKGAMWFIKDPQDQNFHPIRDILERPTLVQLRKLLLSAMMYGMVVAAGVGTVSGVLQLFSRTILPFRWKLREPLSAVPIDLLFLHLVLPYTMQYFRPRKPMKQFGTYLWKYLAAQLRLSSYMFGGRYSSEEYTPKHWNWRMLFIQTEVQMDDAEAAHDGTFRRVPNSDNVALVKDSPATAEVDEDGNPVNAEQARLMALQNAEAEKARRNIKDDYTVVYVPPHLKYRVIAFIACVWIVGSILLGMLLGAPVLLGRLFLRLFIPRDVHDGYSFIAGFYLLWVCWFVGHTIDRMDKRRQRRGGHEARAEWPLYLAKRSFVWIAQISYMAFFLGFVIPTLVALVVEFYIVQPIRHITEPPTDLRIRMVDMWALGLLYSKVIIRCLRLQPDNDFVRGIDHIKRQGWTHLDPFRATKEIIAPITIGLLGMLLLPAGILYGIRQVFSLPVPDDFLFIHLYPSIFTVAGFIHATFALSRLLAAWSQTIRDKEFLVEMRLQNHEADLDQEKASEKDPEPETREEDDEEE
ncbi:hypothetical protein POSPLADRAFT_1138372, partial [Postia placenta MAD-698-R-SB12]